MGSGGYERIDWTSRCARRQGFDIYDMIPISRMILVIPFAVQSETSHASLLLSWLRKVMPEAASYHHLKVEVPYKLFMYNINYCGTSTIHLRYIDDDTSMI